MTCASPNDNNAEYSWVKALSGIEFMLGATFSMHGWDIGSDESIWNIDDGQSLPYLNLTLSLFR